MGGGRGEAPLISERALNRATLARQLLLGRQRRSVIEVAEHLLGLQGQVGNAPYIGLWNRIEGFALDDLSALIESRKMVRATMLRGTVHMLGAEDFLGIRPLLQPMLARALAGSHGRALQGLDIEAVLAAGIALVGQGPLAGGEIGKALQARWPDQAAETLSLVVRSLAPLLHLPPAGLWDRGGAPKLTTPERWLGRAPGAGIGLEALVRRYLNAFGPASVADAQAWSGLSGLGEIFERLRPELVGFRSAAGRELFDLPGAPRPDEDVPAPPRLLPEYDNVQLGYADRGRMIEAARRRAIMLPNGARATVLLDGRVAGVWALRRGKGERAVTIESFAPLRAAEKAALANEAEALLVLAGAAPGNVRFAPLS